MDNKPYRKKQTGNPSKILLGTALAVALSLPYILVKNFSHKIDKPTHSIFLPQEDESSLRDDLEQNENQFQIIDEQSDLKPNQNQNSIDVPEVTSNQELTLSSIPSLVKTTPTIVKKEDEWLKINPKPGDSMATIFHRLGLSAQNLNIMLHKNPYSKILTAIKPSQEFKFLIKNKKLQKLIIPMNDIQTLEVYREGTGYKNKVISKKTTTKELYYSSMVKGSIYSTAKTARIPGKLVQQMISILGKQVDFVHSAKSGDQFSIAYDAQFVKDKLVRVGDIVAVSYTRQGKTAQAIRHISANGNRDYYSPQGQSFKKSFTRYPIKFSHISSSFSTARYHPILHYKRAHKGMDLAAPIGTPILSVGDGIIKSIGRHNGYGNMIQIKHDKTYSTVYGHMLKFQKGLSKGSRVRRGQIIGYVGQTGLATGPHCHFELHVNSQPRNPATVYLPTAAPVPAREMAAFKLKAHTVFAKLKSLGTKTQIAVNKNDKKVS